MATQTPEQLISGGGGLAASGKQEAMCNAFREAVRKYCAKPEGQRGTFNDYFFKELKRFDKKLAKQLQREVPIIMKLAGKASAFVGPATAVARDASLGAAQALAAYMLKGYSPMSGMPRKPGAADSMRMSTHGRYRWGRGKLLNGKVPGANRFFPVFPDAMWNGQVVEVKGPGDTWNRNGQAQDYQKISAPNEPIVPSCGSCAPVNCVNDPKAPNGGCT
ncbi:hypothetical protein [Sorangium sp. So ce388]|uniref:hypothetical protein n=1 Tax=Sorangium sp. So ce388 TaxID=3133309 RepID=UPI003F5B422A